MSILSRLNSIPIYVICGGIIAFVAVICGTRLSRRTRHWHGQDKNDAGHNFQRHFFPAAEYRHSPGCYRIVRQSRHTMAMASLVGNRCTAL